MPGHPETQRLVAEYLEMAGHKDELAGALLRPGKNYVTGELRKAVQPEAVLPDLVLQEGKQVGMTASVQGVCVPSLRATATTKALEHGADIAKGQEWMG